MKAQEELEEKFYKIFSDENEDQDPMFLAHFRQLAKTCASIAESEAIAFASFLIEKQQLVYNQIEGEFFGINREPKEELSELYLLFKESTK